MKKFGLIFISVFTLVLGGLLSACTFKDVKASFTENEVSILAGKTINLDDYLSVEGVDKKNISYRFSNQTIFNIQNNSAKAISYGKSYVYATYQNNNLDSMQIVVKKKFDKPENFKVETNGFLTWNAVSGYFENETTPTVAQKYKVEGSCTIYDTQNPTVVDKVKEISKEVLTNAFELEYYGDYDLTVTALGTGYFCESDKASVENFSFGYMDKIEETSLAWNPETGELSWNAVEIEGAKYKVKFDNIVLGDYQTVKTKNLKSYFEQASAGVHTISVLVYDVNEEKIAKESHVLTIEKFATPVVSYDHSSTGGGMIKIGALANVDKYKLKLVDEKSHSSEIILDCDGQDVLTSLDGLASGIYDVSVIAINENGNYYQSDVVEFGKIYKLPVLQFEGTGENEVNGTTFNVRATAVESLVSSKFAVSGVNDGLVVDGLDVDELVKNFSLEILDVGNYVLNIKNLPKNKNNTIDTQRVYALNSDGSQAVEMVKLTSFGESQGETIVHEYDGGVSKLNFDVVPNATKYTLSIFNGSDFEDVDARKYQVDTANGVITFTGKIEDKDICQSVEIDGVKTYKFKLLASANDDKLAINSSTEKSIALLPAPTTASSGNSLDKTYTWNVVGNASGYKIEIYEINKTIFESNQTEIDINVSGLTKIEDAVTTTPAYAFENVGYYYAKIYALSDNENQFVSSLDCLEEVFYIAEQLEVGTVELGYDENYKNYTGFSASSGYFVKIANTENVASYELTVGEESGNTFKIMSGTDSIFLLSETFESETEVEISVVAHAEDETIYTPSEKKTLMVERLKAVEYSDLQIDQLTSQIQIKESSLTGATGAKIWQSDSNFVSKRDGQFPTMHIATLNNFALEFSLFGTEIPDKIFQNDNQKIYLDSNPSTISFRRLANPTDLKYYNGNLIFKDSAVADSKENYVIDLICNRLDGEPINLTISFVNRLAVATYEGVNVPFGSATTYISLVGNDVTIKLSDIINLIKLNDTLAGIYNQATSISFAVYSYKNELVETEVLLSSQYATLYGDTTNSLLNVEKMGSSELTFTSTATDYTLSWTEVSASTSFATETAYQIYMNGQAKGNALIGTLSSTFSNTEFETSTPYTFYVKAVNPHYLEANNSNEVVIYKLKSIDKITVGTDGNLTYSLSTEERDFVKHVHVVNANAEEDNNTNGIIPIVGAGTYSLKVIGNKVENANSTIYYIDSEASSWTLRDMDDLKTGTETVDYTNNLLIWSAFGQSASLSSLEYIVFFKDKQGGVVQFKTSDIGINLQTNMQLYEDLSSLAAGNITIEISAHLDSYDVASSGIVYYSLGVELPNGREENNYWLYGSDQIIKKLTTPEVVDVVFDYDTLENSQFPDIIISFVGNYGETGKFNIFINDSDIPVLTPTITAVADKYTFTLNKAIYNNSSVPGETFTVKISALDDNAIPSSAGKVDIFRNVDIESVAFEEDDNMYTQSVVFAFDEEQLEKTIGKIVLKIDYQEIGEEASTEIIEVEIGDIAETLKYSMTEFIATNLSKGGTIKLTAYINSYADNANKIYQLASPDVTTSQVYNVLASVETITREAGGFVITNTNNNTTTYIVEYGASNFEVNADATGKFYFEFPNDWGNRDSADPYKLTLYAKENGYVQSNKIVENFTLNRLASITEVSMNRDVDDLSAVNLSWTEVSGATGYLIKMYDRTDVDKSNLLYEFNTIDYHQKTSTTMTAVDGKITYSLWQIFGASYADLISYGKVGLFDLLADLEVSFDLISIGGSTSNNSQAFIFDSIIKGNSITVNDITVDEYGKITFASEVGQKYLYRFLQASDNTVLQDWKVVEATSTSTKIDSSMIATQLLYNVEIVTAGSAVETEVSSSDIIFELDSIPTTTYGDDLTFVVNYGIEDITYDERLISSLAFIIMPNSFTKLYVGLTEDALDNENVLQIVPTSAYPAQDPFIIYSYSFMQLIDELRVAGFEINPMATDQDFYFWSYKETTDKTGSYTISQAYKYTYAFVTETDIKSVEKIGDLGADSKYVEDYANTFITMENKDSATLTTLGVYVKVVHVSADAEPYSVIKFIPKEKLTDTEYYKESSLYVINLTKIFEEEDLFGLSGTFKLEFAKIQTQSIDDGREIAYKFILSDWLTGLDGTEFVFERLRAIETLILSDGNLYWNINDERTEKYYVYFAEEMSGKDLGEKYIYFSTDKTFYNASDYASTGSEYYLAVQGISENPYILSSARTYVIDASGLESEPAKIIKNQITSNLKLKDGKIFIDWDVNGDFYKLLTKDDGTSFSAIASELAGTTFVSPFTFTLKQLLDNDITMRLSFTLDKQGAEGIRKVVDVNAKHLLASLAEFCEENGFNLENRLTNLYASAQNTADKDLIAKFREDVVLKGSHGVANSEILFDDYFENIQYGQYKLEYCLIGNATTLNSTWYEFSNDNNENALFVNAEPSVFAVKEKDDSDISINSYRLMIKKSRIYNWDGNGYTNDTLAENYVVKITNNAQSTFVFAITKGALVYSLTNISRGVDSSESVSVYETDIDGNEISGGDYLMFYFNYNNGDSLLGKFGESIDKRTYQMQVYAVGNNYSTSSKSEYFSLTLLGFGDSFGVSNGEFVWANAQANRKTQVIYKKHSSAADDITEVDGSMRNSRFSLEGLGYGLYDYIKFVVFGDVLNNAILIDSEIYQVTNVYKLAPPTLNNNMGYLGIDDSTNINYLGIDSQANPEAQKCYSDGNLYTYMIYGNEASSFVKISNSGSPYDLLLYELGTTGLDNTNPDYTVKNEEQNAKAFHVSSLGTTASINIEEDPDYYYLRKIYCRDINNNGESTNLSIAIRSQFAEINGAMMDSVQNLNIRNGKLTWDAVTGRDSDSLIVNQNVSSKVIYKIAVVQYKLSGIANGQTSETNVGEVYYYYTTKTEFDFTLIEESQIVTNLPEKTYLKATVQALALDVSVLESIGAVPLVEGGFANGNIMYADTEIYVMMSNGQVLRNIDRLDPIENLAVVDGDVTWTYTCVSSIADEETFFKNYSFVVVGEDGNQINGTFTVTDIQTDTTAQTSTFTIKFAENVGAMQHGVQTLKVYASQGTENSDVVIKSFARTIEINKIDTITSNDFAITSDAETETIDFRKYFENGNTNTVVANIVIARANGNEEKTLQFTKDQYMLYVLRNVDSEPDNYPAGYIRDYRIVVENDEVVRITYTVTNSQEGYLYSDVSQPFVFQRSSWGDDGRISWNENDQKFEWQYSGNYTLSKQITVKELLHADVLTEDTVLFNDSSLSEESAIHLSLGEQIFVESVLLDSAKILYLGNYYYIPLTSFENAEVEGEEITLTTQDVFKVVEQEIDTVVIELENSKRYRVSASDVIMPIYIVEVVYSLDSQDVNKITRTYTTANNYFTPNIIAEKVRIKVRVKLGDLNIQSEELIYIESRDVDYVVFNLFASGDGTEINPYVITGEEEFKNITKRQTKDSALYTFTQDGVSYTEAEQYYFLLENDIELSNINDSESWIAGFMFPGVFSGVINGNGKTISYISNGVSQLSQPITVSDGNVLGAGSYDKSTTFSYGTALFENLSITSSISNLNISVSYTNETIPTNSLMAGLTILNNGKIDGVNLVGFDNDFVGHTGSDADKVMMIYSGIASINSGSVATISNCEVKTDMIVDDNAVSQIIFLSGIVYTNYAKINNCIVGQGESDNFSLQVTCQNRIDTVQVAGIVITTIGEVKNCQNHFDIVVEGTNPIDENMIKVYMAGVADYATGTFENNANSDESGANIIAINIHSSYLTKGSIFAVAR